MYYPSVHVTTVDRVTHEDVFIFIACGLVTFVQEITFFIYFAWCTRGALLYSVLLIRSLFPFVFWDLAG